MHNTRQMALFHSPKATEVRDLRQSREPVCVKGRMATEFGLIPFGTVGQQAEHRHQLQSQLLTLKRLSLTTVTTETLIKAQLKFK